MENKLQIPEILLYNVIDTILKTIRRDLLDNVEEKNTIFYKLFYGTKFENLNLDFYSNAKDIFSRDKSHPRFLDLRMFFNADRANIPTIHLNLPSESDIGGGIGVDEGYNGTNYDPISQTISQNHTRAFNTVYNIIITSDNSDEVIIIYHALRAFMISMLDIIDLNGLKNPKLGGADLQINPELIPPHIFIRAISLNCFYELTIPSLIKEKIIRRIEILSELLPQDIEINVDDLGNQVLPEIIEYHGLDGKSAYEIWLRNGHIGAEIDFLNWLKGIDGREIELQKSLTHIQWRYVGESWFDLVALSDITGPQGAPAITYEKRHKWINPYSYNGKAPLGSLESDAVWKIVRIEIAGDGSVTEIKTLNNVKWSDVLTLIF